MLTASKYSHYGLFSIPFLASNASYGIYESLKNKSLLSKLTLKVFGALSFLIGIAIFLGILFNAELKITYDIGLVEIFAILFLTIVLIILSFKFIRRINYKLVNINTIISIFSIIIIIFSLLFAKGIIGNPNSEFKYFLNQSEVYEVISSNNIYLIGKLDSKNRHLLQFYIPKSKKMNIEKALNSKDIYGIISDRQLVRLNDSIKGKFIILKEYKNINFVKVN